MNVIAGARFNRNHSWMQEVFERNLLQEIGGSTKLTAKGVSAMQVAAKQTSKLRLRRLALIKW